MWCKKCQKQKKKKMNWNETKNEKGAQKMKKQVILHLWNGLFRIRLLILNKKNTTHIAFKDYDSFPLSGPCGNVKRNENSKISFAYYISCLVFFLCCKTIFLSVATSQQLSYTGELNIQLRINWDRIIRHLLQYVGFKTFRIF